VGAKKLTRVATSVMSQAATFTIDNIVKPAGFDVVVTPSSFTLQPGEKAKPRHITISTKLDTTFVLGAYYHGSITWSSGTTRARVPVVVAARFFIGSTQRG